MGIPVDWLYGLAGGVIIGLAASMYLLMNGRIMGASGILGGLVDGTARSGKWEQAAFVVGLVLFPAFGVMKYGVPENNVTSSLPILIAAGLLVGIGTRIANGCTSGHGVCGISRFSLRSLWATVFYLLGGGISLYLFRHVLELI